METSTKKKIGTLAILLIDIATGPHHCDFAVKNQPNGGRVLLDVHMSQFVSLKIQPVSIACTFRETLSASKYCYSANLLVG